MKALLLALPLAVLAAGSALANDPIPKQVLITATVPTAAFHVEPIGGNWLTEPQQMGWDPRQEALLPIRRQLTARSTVGPISARLEDPATIASGTDIISLNVRVGATDLTTTATQILAAQQAAVGSTLDFVVAPTVPTGGYKPGNYQGLVRMTFETAAPPAT